MIFSIFSKEEESHYKNTEIVLFKLPENELYVSPKKCDYLRDEVDFLGLLLGNSGIKMNSEYICNIKKWPKLSSLNGLQSFLGLFSSFAKSFQKLARILCLQQPFLTWNQEYIERMTSLTKHSKQ